MPFVYPFQKTVCPCCFHSFYMSRAHIRDFTESGEREDVHIGKFLGTAGPLMAATSVPPGKWYSRFFLPQLISTNQVRVCPECHYELWHKAECYPPEFIAFIGCRSSGKSNYIPSLIDLLRERYCSESGFEFMGETAYDPTTSTMRHSSELCRIRYSQRYPRDRSHGMMVPQTTTAELSSRFPLVFRVTRRSNWKDRVAHLCLFDTAGEGLETITEMARRTFYNYIYMAAGIVFLIGPEELACLQGAGQRSDDTLLRSESLAEVICQEYEKRRQKGKKALVPTPVAFVISKCDLLTEWVSKETTFLNPTDHSDGFNEDTSARKSAELEAFLETQMPRALLGKLKKMFPVHRFFAASAVGQAPRRIDTGETLDSPVSPLNVGDPFLWLLYRRGIIREGPVSRRNRGLR